MNAQAGSRWAVMTAVAGTVFIAVGAFWLSFTSLADLARRSGIGTGQAWAWPLIVDGIIVVATVAVVALAGTRASWYPWALLIGGASVSVTANAIHAVIAADADVPGILAGAVAAVPPVVLLAITHLTVILTRPPGPQADAKPSDIPVSLRPDADDETLTVSPESLEGPALPVLIASGQGTEPAYDGDLNLASSADRRVRAADLHEVGWSNKQIARELGVHPSTVGRWLTALTEQSDDESTDDEAPNNTPEVLSNQAPNEEENS
ncbi:Putative phage excisionase [Propionibacterium freudenreichii]|uniref:DUF2637 domain-containing protein n=1 Tax=Propionibacterium freudenreichii TaxID=1744 RepID=UPI0005A5C607|nr:DUF2637 domain-containing protein [Propionibacterium freudenreichii]CEI26734.1 Putative phage excisionase [Propionibacterium freudenreichii]SBN95879.1 Putative phage excisionase [Propionibacterium freudenreichii]SCC97465.1 Putative phage excisionase [Propionibacterium freudenreichii]